MHEQFGTRASVESSLPYRNAGSSTLADDQWADRWGTPTEAQVAKTYLYTKRGQTMSRAAGVAVAGGGGGVPPQQQQQPGKGSPLSPLHDPLLIPSRPTTPAKKGARTDGLPSPMRLTAPEERRSGEVEMSTIHQAAAAVAAAAVVGEEVLSLEEEADHRFLEKTAARMYGRTCEAAAAGGGGECSSSEEDEDIWRSNKRAQARMQGRTARASTTEEAASEGEHAATSASATERRPGGEEGDGGGGRRPVQRGTTTTSYGQHARSRGTHGSSEFILDEDDEMMLRDLESSDMLVIGQVQSDDLNAVD